MVVDLSPPQMLPLRVAVGEIPQTISNASMVVMETVVMLVTVVM
jgi:hypothetical protein